ncbi:MAG: Smr/MutS family protein [Pseudotabrizicola sp.]|uniref:Smr/MutS family protein n=1 Tax=Pseudotabrizicola sp. TaxID=2939647 RepID=UPI0027247BF0|nr:Smr/MutS family protein [Pseudotabrizicola sp.]MDO9639200.1 Smr/MutS family protein [Pseudotabrizicola sp.]
MARRRTLRPDEVDLWHAVARTARPMHSNGTEVLHGSEKPDEPKPLTAPEKPSPPLAPFRLGEKSRSPAPRSGLSLHKPPAETAVQMDAKAYGRMTRGKLAPEARIDLHGLTLAEAHPDLIRFILNAHAQGLRLVLVITGKGKTKPDHGPIPSRIGALRHQVPQWLRLPPIGGVVLQVAESHAKHGGSGAYYVYLRRGK